MRKQNNKKSAKKKVSKKKPNNSETLRKKRQTFTAAKQKLFLDAYSEHGVVGEACKKAGVSVTTYYNFKRENPDFAERVIDAFDSANDVLEYTAYHRAVHGVDKGIYHDGEKIATEKRFSDGLLMFLLKGRRPEKFRDNVSLEHKGNVKISLFEAFKKLSSPENESNE